MAAKAPAHLRPTAGGRLSWRSSFMSLLGAQSRHARRRCRCPLSGAALTDRSHRQRQTAGFFPAPRARNFLGYRREFLPARGLIVRNVHIGKPRARRGVFWPPARLSAVCSQPMQRGQRRLVLDISNTRLIRKNDHAYSPPFRFQVTCTVSRGALRQAILACAPRRDTCPWLRYRGLG